MTLFSTANRNLPAAEQTANPGGFGLWRPPPLHPPHPTPPHLRPPGRDRLPGLAARPSPGGRASSAPSAEGPGAPSPRHFVFGCPGPGLVRRGAMATWRRDGRLTGSQRLLCAGLAGALSLSLTAPLELVTVLAQVGVVRGRHRGPWATGLAVWRAEGPRALWTGTTVACLRLFPYSALQLTAYRK